MTGGARVNIYSGALDALAADALAPIITEALEAGVDMAQRLVPIDTGELHDGIGIIDHEDTRGSYGVTDVDHALFVEFGTARGPEQPYLRPSIDAVTQVLRRAR